MTHLNIPSGTRQRTPASSEWPQLLTPRPRFEHSKRHDSFPKQLTSSRTMVPVPGPNAADETASRAPAKPRDRQTTMASFVPQPSSQTVPHSLLYLTSTRPSESEVPPTRRTSPSVTRVIICSY